MIIRTEDLKSLCSKILFATSSVNDFSELTDILQLKTEGRYLHLCVTNNEYFVDVKLDTFEEDNFNATISAGAFLKLISNTSSESVELNVNGNVLEVVCDGRYSVPIITDDSDEQKMIELPRLSITNVTKTIDVDASVLNSILNYNTREITKGIVGNQVQRMYYIDEHGAITFSSGACVNSFELGTPVSVLLPSKVVKLFKLFKDGNVIFKIGYDSIDGSDTFTQMKVSFENEQVSVVAVLPLGDTLLNSVPVEAIRNRAFDSYDFSVVFRRESLLNAINRLSIFSSLDQDIVPYVFEFSTDYVTISNKNKTNMEDVYYSNEVKSLGYECKVFLFDLKSALEAYKNEYVTVKFGNGKAIVLVHDNIYNIIPECSE